MIGIVDPELFVKVCSAYPLLVELCLGDGKVNGYVSSQLISGDLTPSWAKFRKNYDRNHPGKLEQRTGSKIISSDHVWSIVFSHTNYAILSQIKLYFNSDRMLSDSDNFNKYGNELPGYYDVFSGNEAWDIVRRS